MRLFSALLLLPLGLFAQLDWVADHPGTIVYTLDLDRAQQHELRITIDFPAVGPDVFYAKMPQASPGRYAVHNFAKNVYAVEARGADGQEIPVYREDGSTWAIAGHGGAVRLSYTLFANGGDGTYSGIDDRKLHLNMPATFIYGENLNDRPVLLTIPPQDRPDWDVATQLVDVGQRRYAAPNYYYFYDSPTLVGDMMRAEWTVTSNGNRTDTIEVAMMHDGDRKTFDAYVEMVKKVVDAQQQVYGELPAFDYGRYVFLCSYNQYIGGDGMEHRNSTICSAPIDLAGNEDRLIGTVSHEFFHCWNVERIRPASLEPFDFDHANMSGELWFAEGFTSYYDDLLLVRAGILSPEEYAENMAGTLNYVVNSPGRKYRNPIQMSQQAPFVDAATANDPDNFANTFVSYYPYGATIGLALDLELRERGHDLDELMRLVWQRYGRTEIPYHVRDLEIALGDVVGDRDWAAKWFERHIYGSELPAFDELLEPFGVTVAQAQPDSAGFYRLRVEDAGDGAGVEISGLVLENNPLFAAGVDRGSVITALDGRSIANVADWNEAVKSLRTGKEYEVEFEQLGRERRGRFAAAASPAFRSSLRGLTALGRDWLGQ